MGATSGDPGRLAVAFFLAGGMVKHWGRHDEGRMRGAQSATMLDRLPLVLKLDAGPPRST